MSDDSSDDFPGSESFTDPRDRIVALADFDRRIAQHTLAELRAYWHSLQKGRAVPDRAQIDPQAIQRTLEYAFILERVAAGHARLRIAGMHLNDLMGMEVRGMPLASFFTPGARPALQEALEQVFTGPEIIEATLCAEEGFGKPPMTARLLLLPLRSDLGDISRALGCLIAEGQIGRAPRRFGISAVEISAVIAGAKARALTDLGDARCKKDADPPQGLAEPAAQTPAPAPPICDASTQIRPPGNDSPEARRAGFRVIT